MSRGTHAAVVRRYTSPLCGHAGAVNLKQKLSNGLNCLYIIDYSNFLISTFHGRLTIGGSLIPLANAPINRPLIPEIGVAIVEKRLTPPVSDVRTSRIKNDSKICFDTWKSVQPHYTIFFFRLPRIFRPRFVSSLRQEAHLPP